MCESDFTKGLAEMTATEQTAASEYDRETKENEITKATKDQDVKYKTKEAIKRAGICVCLGVGKVKLPDYMRNLNFVCRTTEEAKEIAKRAIGVQKNL